MKKNKAFREERTETPTSQALTTSSENIEAEVLVKVENIYNEVAREGRQEAGVI